MGEAAPEPAGAAGAALRRLPAGWALTRGALAGVAVFGAAAAAFAFLLLPVVAIFAHVSPGRLVAQLSNPVVTDALVLSLKTSAIAQALVLCFGTPAAYLLATRRFRGRSLAIVLVELPLVLPPAVAGIGLIAAFGTRGLLGHTLSVLGIHLGLTQTAVVIAVAFVASPLYLRQAIATFETIDPDLVAASRTLGASRMRTFFRVVLPLAQRGLAAGEGLAFARGLGEFGATIMFAGSLQGVTQTLPLAIYTEFDIPPNGFTTALAMSALLVVVSGALLVALRVTLQWQPSRPTSRFLFAPSS
jgi:molybdate transport system permease protein